LRLSLALLLMLLLGSSTRVHRRQKVALLV